MNKIKLSLIIGLSIVILVAVILFVVGAFNPRVAGIYVETNPVSSVYINGVSVGTTPVRTTLKAGETVVKLVPQSFDTPLIPYETKINFVAGVETVMNLDFGSTDDDLASEIISFEKIAKGETSMVVVSIPDSAQIVVDGRERSFAPFKTSNITSGEHNLTLSAKGYKDRSFDIKTHDGYKLTAVVKLARNSDEAIEEPVIPTQSPSEEEKTKEMVEILSTGTGFLRVREKPSSLGDEVGKVDPGKLYPFIEKDGESGWYKIEYLEAEGDEEAKTGWISGEYAKIVENNSTSTATPSAPLTPTRTQ